jgi:hypothetical protein
MLFFRCFVNALEDVIFSDCIPAHMFGDFESAAKHFKRFIIVFGQPGANFQRYFLADFSLDFIAVFFVDAKHLLDFCLHRR